MQIEHYLELLQRAHRNLGSGFRDVAAGHPDETEVYYIAQQLAGECDRQVEALSPYRGRHPSTGNEQDPSPSAVFGGTRPGSLGLLRDLQELYVLTSECDIAWTVLDRASQGARDTELQATVHRCQGETRGQLAWLRTQLTHAAAQTLVVA